MEKQVTVLWFRKASSDLIHIHLQTFISVASFGRFVSLKLICVSVVFVGTRHQWHHPGTEYLENCEILIVLQRRNDRIRIILKCYFLGVHNSP